MQNQHQNPQQQSHQRRRLSSSEAAQFNQQQQAANSRYQTNPFLYEPQIQQKQQQQQKQQHLERHGSPIYQPQPQPQPQQQLFASSLRRFRRLSDNQLDSNCSQATSLIGNVGSNYGALHLDPNQVAAISNLPIRRHSSAAPGLELQQDQHWQQQQQQQQQSTKPLHLNLNYSMKLGPNTPRKTISNTNEPQNNYKQQQQQQTILRQQETPSSVSQNSTSTSISNSSAPSANQAAIIGPLNNNNLSDETNKDFSQQSIVCARSGSLSDDVDLVFNRLMSLEAFRKLHPSVIRNLCSYASIERIDKGVIGE